MLVWARQKTLQTRINDLGVIRRQAQVVKSVLDHRARLEVFGHYIRSGTKTTRHLGAFGVLQVELDAFLVAIEHWKESCPSTQKMACAVPLNWLNFDDLGPEVGQHHATSG